MATFILGYIAGMVITFFAIAFFMGAGGKNEQFNANT